MNNVKQEAVTQDNGYEELKDMLEYSTVKNTANQSAKVVPQVAPDKKELQTERQKNKDIEKQKKKEKKAIMGDFTKKFCEKIQKIQEINSSIPPSQEPNKENKPTLMVEIKEKIHSLKLIRVTNDNNLFFFGYKENSNTPILALKSLETKMIYFEEALQEYCEVRPTLIYISKNKQYAFVCFTRYGDDKTLKGEKAFINDQYENEQTEEQQQQQMIDEELGKVGGNKYFMKNKEKLPQNLKGYSVLIIDPDGKKIIDDQSDDENDDRSQSNKTGSDADGNSSNGESSNNASSVGGFDDEDLKMDDDIEEGTIMKISLTNLKVHKKYIRLGKIVDIVSDEEDSFIIVANKQNEIIYLDLATEEREVIKKKGKERIKCLKLSENDKVLVVYCDTQPVEQIQIWNVPAKVMISKEMIDLEDRKQLREMPDKLFCLSQTDNQLFVREGAKGVKVVSLEDGTELQMLQKLHKNPILHINISNNNKWLVTCGRDKKVIVTEWISKIQLACFKDHASIVQFATFCKNDDYLFTTGDDKAIFVYHTSNWFKILQITDCPVSLDILQFSSDGTFLLGLDSDTKKNQGQIAFYWKLENNDEETRLNLSNLKNVEAAYITPDEKYLIIAPKPSRKTLTTVIEVWDLQNKYIKKAIQVQCKNQTIAVSNHKENYYVFYESAVGVLAMHDIKTDYCAYMIEEFEDEDSNDDDDDDDQTEIQGQKKVKKVLFDADAPNDDKLNIKRKETQDGITSIFIDSKDRYLYSVGENGKIVCWDITTKSPKKQFEKYVREVKNKNDQIPLCVVHLSSNDEKLYVTDKKGYVYEYYLNYEDVSKGVQIRDFVEPYRENTRKVQDLVVTDDDRFIILGGKNSNVIFKDHIEKTSKVEKVHKTKICFVGQTKSKHFLTLSATEACLWKAIRVKDEKKNKTKNTQSKSNKKKNKKSKKKFNKTGKSNGKSYGDGKDEKTDEKVQFVQVALIEECIVPVFSSHREIRGILTKEGYRTWSKRVIEEFTDETNDNQGGKNVYSTKQAITDKKEEITGEFNLLYPYIFQSMIMEGRSKQAMYMPAMCSNFVLPYGFNMLHYFSYNDNPGCIEKLLECDAQFQEDTFGHSPLLYALKRGSYECADILLDYIMETENIYSQITEKEIKNLIKTSPSNLIEFFNDSIEIIDKDVPRYGTIKGKKICFHEFDSVDIDENDASFMVRTDIKSRKPIEICSLKFRYNFQQGSKSSIQLLKALMGTQSDEIFKSFALQRILNYKWQQSRFHIISEAIFILLYTIYLFCVSQFARENQAAILALAVFGCCQILLEFFEMVLTIKFYFKSIWNYFDLIIGMLTVGFSVWKIYIIRNLDGNIQYMIYPDYILAFLTLMLWLRLISYLRIFRKTRTLIRLIVEIGQDILAFGIVMIMACCAFAITADIMINHNNRHPETVLDTFSNIYVSVFGQFYTYKFDEPQWILFFASTIFLTLVMMNMLIAIMNDSYEKMSNSIEIEDNKEVLSIIYDIESLLVWKRRSGRSTYLHWAQEMDNTSLNRWQGRMNEIKRIVSHANGSSGGDDDGEDPLIKQILEQLKVTEMKLQIKFDEVSKKAEQLHYLDSTNNGESRLGENPPLLTLNQNKSSKREEIRPLLYN